MLLNADQIEQMLTTNGAGKKAQVGYDLTLGSVSLVRGRGVLTKDKSSIPEYSQDVMNYSVGDSTYFVLFPGVYSFTFEQGCALNDRTTAFIKQRSSLLRMGVQVTSGVYDPGFHTELMGGIAIVHTNVTIEQGARVAQILMVENTPTTLYDGQFQGEKDIK